MRVVHVITRLIVGGAQENTVATVLGLHRQPGVAVKLISGPTTGPEGSIESSFDAHPPWLHEAARNALLESGTNRSSTPA